MARFRFSEPTGANFPTDASVVVDWQDGTPRKKFDFTHSGDQEPVLSHKYIKRGFYNVSANIYNAVSDTSVTCSVSFATQEFSTLLWSVFL